MSTNAKRKTITIHADPTREEIIRWAESALRNAPDGCVTPQLVSDLVDDFKDGLPALISEPESCAAPLVSVLPMEWGETSYGAPEAVTALGIYRIQDAWSGGYTVDIGRRILRPPNGLTNSPTIEEAKALAFADYERHILETIAVNTFAPRLPPPPWVTDMIKAAEAIISSPVAAFAIGHQARTLLRTALEAAKGGAA
ncbi:hypothetical protein [uncultured Martelella sp.]|uniref:hypothetical protein n=1 Tax=uncultured Martelella sp. TaxID=392331 RepID=UPI0029C6C173|nr:hypothetical protein [uncultured Martelella sp.]